MIDFFFLIVTNVLQFESFNFEKKKGIDAKGSKDGTPAYAIVLNGGYADDDDQGDTIWFSFFFLSFFFYFLWLVEENCLLYF